VPASPWLGNDTPARPAVRATPDAAMHATQLALNIDLLLPGNEKALLDTMLHEMAHVEAWLVHGHREHGRIWRDVARRVGCEAKACTHMRMRRRKGGDAVTHVPKLKLPTAPAGPPLKAARSGLRKAARQRA
jgi:hypothetical protein